MIQQRSLIDVFLFKLFVFTLSLGRFIDLPFGDFYAQVVPHFSTSVMFVGFFLLILRQAKIIDVNVLPFVKFWRFSVIYTVLVCTFLSVLYILGFANGIDPVGWNIEIPYRAMMRDMVFWCCCIMSLLYSYYNLRYVVQFGELKGVIEWSILAILFVGLLQFGVLNGNGLCAVVYFGLGSVFKLVDLIQIGMLERGICFWGSEPASASMLCMFVLPFSIITFFKSKGWRKARFFSYVTLFLFLLLNSGSSSTLITSVLVLICAVLYIIKGSIKKWMYIATFSMGLTIAVLYMIDIDVNNNAVLADKDSLEYIILGKLVDKENGSTAMRVSTLCNDMKIFMLYPITGVGNGCQGYFYKYNIPDWVKFSDEVQNVIAYGTGSIANGGGNFFASYISGYGIIGIFILWSFIKQYRIRLRYSKIYYDSVSDFTFSVCIIVFLLAGWYVQSIEDNKLMFMLALGCVPYKNELK